MKTYLITDTHFNHTAKMMEYCQRPVNYEELLWKGLEELPVESTLIHLGDICIGKDAEVHERIAKLPSKYKILVRGNHDKKSDKWYKSHGWNEVVDKLSEHYNGVYITFSHIPIKDIQNINIHGHFHNSLHRIDADIKTYYNSKLHRLMAVEFTDYKPVDLEAYVDFYLKGDGHIQSKQGSDEKGAGGKEGI